MKLHSEEFKLISDKSYDNIYNYTKLKVLTRILNSLSLTFCVGEKFFCQAIRDHAMWVDEDMQKEIKEFIRQEAQHSMAHRSLNQCFAENGLAVKYLEDRALYRLNYLGNSPEQRLMTTKALESLTAFGGKLYFKANWFFKPCQTSELWAHHAKEEVQHEFVAEEVFKSVYGANTLKYYLHFCRVVVQLVLQIVENYVALKQIEGGLK